MSAGRHLFLLWVVFSLIWLILIGVMSAGKVMEEFQKAATMRALKAGGYKPDLPIDCSLARGKAGTDYRLDGNPCWYEMDTFRKIYPEYKNIDDDALSQSMYRKAGMPLIEIRPWSLLAKRIGIAAVLPLFVLGLGLALM